MSTRPTSSRTSGTAPAAGSSARCSATCAPGCFARMPWFVRYELRAVVEGYIGQATEEAALRAPLASPLRRLSEPPVDGARPLPPFFAAVGTADPLLHDSRRLKEVIEARGGRFDLHEYPGEVHGFNAFLWRPAARTKWRALHAFLSEHAGDAAPQASEWAPSSG